MMSQFSVFPTQHWAKFLPEKLAIVWKKGESSLLSDIPEQLSWREWQQLIAQAIGFMTTLGVKEGQLVAYVGSHRLIGLICYCAVIALGGRIMVVNPAMPISQRQNLFKQNKVDNVIADQDFAKFSTNLTACHHFNYSPYQPATFTFTSGSSGLPKAVVHCVQQHLDNAYGVCELMSFNAQHSWLFSLPLFHVSGQGIVWRWLAVGATLVVVEDKQELLASLDTVSHASLVPTQLQRYLNYLESNHQVNPKPAQHFLLGGATIPPDLIHLAQQQQITTYAGYGMTEMASTVCATMKDCDNVGRPLSGREVKIVDNEIWVKGSGLGLGYWLEGEIKPFTNEQGWFVTKDRGHWNSEHKLVVEGRLDNMFISGGENIQPEEVERILFSSGIIEAIFIIPIKDDEFGERPIALVEFQQTFSLQAVKILQEFAKQHLEGFKRPVRYLPLNLEKWQNAGIKISRVQLKQYVAGILNENDS